MVTIVFEAHGTTFDNENHLSSGHFDVVLPPSGEKQAKELGERYKDEHFNIIFCSDLQRSSKDLLARSRNYFTARFEEPCLFASQKRKTAEIASKL